jgi:hypothetical protein
MSGSLWIVERTRVRRYERGRTGGAATHLNGYSIIQAEDIDDVLNLVKDHPFLTHGHEHSIEIYSLP